MNASLNQILRRNAILAGALLIGVVTLFRSPILALSLIALGILGSIVYTASHAEHKLRERKVRKIQTRPEDWNRENQKTREPAARD